LISSFVNGATLLEEEDTYLTCLLLNYHQDNTLLLPRPVSKEVTHTPQGREFNSSSRC